jgi:hypothetical protein
MDTCALLPATQFKFIALSVMLAASAALAERVAAPDGGEPEAAGILPPSAQPQQLAQLDATDTPASGPLQTSLRRAYPHPRGYVCLRAPSPPPIDGTVLGGAWDGAPWTGAFVDIEGPAKVKDAVRGLCASSCAHACPVLCSRPVCAYCLLSCQQLAVAGRRLRRSNQRLKRVADPVVIGVLGA